jgi:rhamnulose-1-phosphate aldolase/alcohol dehydrogenase
MQKSYRYVNYLWNDSAASQLSEVDRLAYRSNILASDLRITNTGGGNTSTKLWETDPLTGEKVEVMWVKGSGGDLRTAKRANFASVYLQKILHLEKAYRATSPHGPKTAVEDGMVERYLHAAFNLNPCVPSIDTPLHAFIPHKCVDHTHPNAIIALAASRDGEKITREIYGDEVIWTGWQRPGFDLGLILHDVCRKHPQAKGIILGQHGLINWTEDDKSCYELSLDLIERAAAFLAERDKGAKTFGGPRTASLGAEERRTSLVSILPVMRGLVSKQKKMIGTVHAEPAILDFVNSVDAPRLVEMGTSCPDHFLRTKIKPLYVDWHPQNENLDQLEQKLKTAIDDYRADYEKYYLKNRKPDSPPMRDASPSVILIPGIGLIAWVKNKSESRVTAEFYNCAVDVIRGAEAVSTYISLDQQEAFDIEYWWLEENKLRRQPTEQELARQIIVVAGGGSGIGRETCQRIAPEGACVAAIDLNEAGAQETAKLLTDRLGLGIGVAGTGISNCGTAVGLAADVTSRPTIRRAVEEVILAYGGIDSLVVTAGYYAPSDLQGRIADDKWALTYAINVTGVYFFAEEVAKVWQKQGLPGSMVITTSANAVVPKKGMLAYDTSKAAANHLVRELALELSPLIRVNGVAPATVIQGSSMFPRDRIIASLAKYNLPYQDDEKTEVLTDRLARFYADRTLTKQPITPADQAEAVFLLLGRRLSKTTGQIIAVDGGLHEAFLR